MIPVYHVAGCGGIAFYFTTQPGDGMKLTPDVVVYPDGDEWVHPEWDTKALCLTCLDDLEITELTVTPPPSDRA